jgi:KDO2-lipid IV(A) lauroyltransferase
MIKKLLSKYDIKTRLSILLLEISSKLSLKSAHFIGACIGWIALRIPGSLLRVTQKNIALCFPEMDKTKRQELVRNSLRHTAYLMMELGLAWLRPVEKNLEKIVNVTGQDIMESAVKQGQGVIVLAPHLGNWEWLNVYTSKIYPGVSVYKQPKQPLFDRILLSSREKGGGQLAPANTAGVKIIYRHLKQGGIVYILPDQVPGTEGGLIAPFFSIPALTMTLVSRLTSKTGAKVVAVYGKRLNHHQGFEVVFKNVDERIYSPDMKTSVTGLNATVESCVRDIPEQYQWSYKRFKRGSELHSTIYSKP